MNNHWTEQLERVRRYKRRFDELTAGKSGAPTSEDYVDDVYAFFLNCYHLKDWLISDVAYTKHSGDEIERHIKCEPTLALVADICNGHKHFLLRKPRSGSIPTFVSKSVHVRVGADSSQVSMILEIEHGGGRLDAYQIATKALEAWEAFI